MTHSASLLSQHERDALLGVALGRYNARTEHRYRHRSTGETLEYLDLRIHHAPDWASESRTVIEGQWT